MRIALIDVPYDCGLVFCREPVHLQAAMRARAAYLVEGEAREPDQFVPDFSRRARGVEVWAALLSLGRAGLRDLVERTCRHARRFAEGLRADGHVVRNDVVLNQVLVTFGSPDRTRRIIREIQQGGVLWCGGTEWQGHTAVRISVSGPGASWNSTTAVLEAVLPFKAASWAESAGTVTVMFPAAVMPWTDTVYVSASTGTNDGVNPAGPVTTRSGRVRPVTGSVN